MLKISTVVLYGDSQPDFTRLKARGWVNPLGLHDEPLGQSLTKSYGSLQFQVVQHGHKSPRAVFRTYTEIYLHHASEFTMVDLLGAVLWLQEELE